MFFNSRAVGGSASWKEYFLWRDTLEKGMASGTPGADFKCKSLRGHAGIATRLLFVGFFFFFRQGLKLVEEMPHKSCADTDANHSLTYETTPDLTSDKNSH